ncbi:hypothetical protein LOY38_06245 [Pseudomonas sp. B21-015]|uniref:hypothetical protein n=1 Tax=Pseudomonas sp. B21-015 TaxID=2895473 RepID=UPI0021603EA0|nr:hypothetical protein [Pseudomonas sp. B21-015]UVM51641.1 hypothetical protein LOY38_06245 [Pseudomonas sp. B21-015]
MFDLSLLTGKIIFDDLSLLTDQPLAGQIDALKEDLLQVEYGKQLLLDVGWYPEFDEDGAFRVVVIKDHHWDYPQWTGQAQTLAELTARLTEAQRELHARLDLP